MNIFEYADDINWMADYMDMTTGNVYKISAVRDMKDHIPVYDFEGNYIGDVDRADPNLVVQKEG